MIDLKKALTTSSGSALIPTKLDKLLIDVVSKDNPLRKWITPMPWSTLVYPWNVRTALTTASTYSETTGFGGGESTIGQRTVTIKMLKAEGAVSNLLQAVSTDYINALQEEIDSAINSLAMEEARLDILGNATVGEVNDTAAGAITEYDGLSVQCTDTVDASGSALTLAMLDSTIEEVKRAGGVPNLIVISPRDYTYLKLLCKNTYLLYWSDLGKDLGVPKYENIPVVINPWVPETLSDGNATPSLTRSILFVLDTRYIKRPMVQNVKYNKVEASTDSTAFRINEYLSFAVKATERQRKIIDIAQPS